MATGMMVMMRFIGYKSDLKKKKKNCLHSSMGKKRGGGQGNLPGTLLQYIVIIHSSNSLCIMYHRMCVCVCVDVYVHLL